MLYITILALLISLSYADMYMHFPRGSNNRLNEASATRNNANRLFDSQNNNRGGYNVGDMDPNNGFAAATYMATFTEMYDFRFLYQGGTLEKQYEMMYFEDTWMSVTWTNQHGTGNAKLSSHIILQYICDTFPRATAAGANGAVGPQNAITTTNFGTSAYHQTPAIAAQMRQHGLRVELYNGGNTNTPDEPDDLTEANVGTEYNNNNANNRGRRESEEYYILCNRRSRNYGLFHADQDLNGDTQIYTRQNPGGTRRGLECPEERDYYPYWNPTPFHDVAIITPDVDYCNEVLAPESQNVQMKYHCVKPDVDETTTEWLPEEEYVIYNLNETECYNKSGAWLGWKWDGEEPECVDSYWSKVNHLGNVEGTNKRGGKQAHYDWKIPTFDELTQNHYCYPYDYEVTNDHGDTSGTDIAEGDEDYKCVRLMFRARYNMSTMDYDPYKTNSSYDEEDDEEPYIISPIENNPTVDVGAYVQGLQLAINTAQTGRTFEDNSHTFLVCQRPSPSDFSDKNIYNVNVRGKRGNIVQTFPATEYDFEPQHIFMTHDTDCLHFQWTGSNTHNNGDDGGDGQTGDAGQGTTGTDRHNLLQARELDESYPITYDKFDDDFFDYMDCYHPLYPSITVSADSARLILGTGGFYKSVDYAEYHISTKGEDAVMDVLLNDNSPSFRQGLMCCSNDKSLDDDSLYHGCQAFSFICSRNNNFTNRSQKLKIEICKDGSAEDMSLW